MPRVRDMFISYSELISGICRASEKKIMSERAISRSVHGVEKMQFLCQFVVMHNFKYDRMQKDAKYSIFGRRHMKNNEACNDLMMHGILP